MSRSASYEQMRALARDIRACYGLETPRVTRSDMRRIYRDHGIRIDLWPEKGAKVRLKRLRGAYFSDDSGTTVMIDRYLPEDPAIFTMGHELKHHLVDRVSGVAFCDMSNENSAVEIAAEVFAAELIFPQDMFIDELQSRAVGLGFCTPNTIVTVKHDTRTTLSYTGLGKIAERLGFAVPGTMANIPWKRIEYDLYGEPLYKVWLRTRA